MGAEQERAKQLAVPPQEATSGRSSQSECRQHAWGPIQWKGEIRFERKALSEERTCTAEGSSKRSTVENTTPKGSSTSERVQGTGATTSHQ
mmetsp:Transcript_22373/g.43538  ORF Transcript_22373/g.43538 Transcript_22373/m.43538 type:complete len:91 (+) Transcript_22373:953-1225(+)